jgi:hypothetical protein
MENGWSVAADPGDTDVMREAAARYQRAVGECGQREDRPDRLRRAVSLLCRALMGDSVSFAAAEGARVAAPAEREKLLEDWVSALAPLVEKDDHYYGDRAHRLLLEVVEQLEGLPGLAKLARSGGRPSRSCTSGEFEYECLRPTPKIRQNSTNHFEVFRHSALLSRCGARLT